MNNFKVVVICQNNTTFKCECQADTQWQAEAMARVKGRQLGLGGFMDVVKTTSELSVCDE